MVSARPPFPPGTWGIELGGGGRTADLDEMKRKDEGGKKRVKARRRTKRGRGGWER